jgi:hypothetical protein
VNLQIQKKFIQWYFNEPFPGKDSKRNRNGFLEEFLVNSDKSFNADSLRYWIEKAYHEGAKAQMELIKEDWYRQNKDAN